MINIFIKYILFTYNITINNSLSVIFYCFKEKKYNTYNNNIILNKLKYIKKSVENVIPANLNYFNNYTECNIQNKLSFEKCCDNKSCQKKLMHHITWYCYNGSAYCSPECRTQYINVIENREYK